MFSDWGGNLNGNRPLQVSARRAASRTQRPDIEGFFVVET
jgi:hypothetical protein